MWKTHKSPSRGDEVEIYCKGHFLLSIADGDCVFRREELVDLRDIINAVLDEDVQCKT